MDHVKEPAKKLIFSGPEVIEYIRKEHKLDKEEDRERAIAIVNEWIQAQDHLVVKDYSKSYIEKCIITSNGSLERAKKQIDRLCTMRTLMPKYFQTTNIKESDIINLKKTGHFALLPKQTKDYYRVIILKSKPDTVLHASDYTLFYKLLVVIGEYLRANDFCRGYILIADIFDASVTNIVSRINLVELQQFLPVLTEGYGCHIKGIYLVTASKFIEGFIRLVKPLFSEKIGNRIHAVTARDGLQNFINGDVLPEQYGGNEKPIEELQDNLFEALIEVPMQELLKKMNKAVTDESKRRTDKFNDQYIGMPGTFRTLSLD